MQGIYLYANQGRNSANSCKFCQPSKKRDWDRLLSMQSKIHHPARCQLPPLLPTNRRTPHQNNFNRFRYPRSYIKLDDGDLKMKQHLPTSRCNTWPPLDPVEKWETFCCWWQKPESWSKKNYPKTNSSSESCGWPHCGWHQFDDTNHSLMTGRTNPEMSKIDWAGWLFYRWWQESPDNRRCQLFSSTLVLTVPWCCGTLVL